MNITIASVAAAIASIIGAALWAALSYFAGIEHGLLAVAIGGGVGLATRLGAKGDRGISYGLIAASFAILAIFVGKYTSAYLTVDKIFAFDVNTVVTEQDAISTLASDIAAKWEEEGKTLAWPAEDLPEDASAASVFPPDVWAEANKTWAEMPEDRRALEIKAIQASREAISKELQKNNGAKQAFIFDLIKQNLGVFDLLFFGIAIFAAFKGGSGGDE